MSQLDTKGHNPRARSLGGRLKAWSREIRKPQVIIPIVIALGMLAYVSSVAVARNSANELWTIMQQTWVLILLLTFPYLAARALIWTGLLTQLGITVPFQQILVSFSAGEATKSLPAGVYIQNYVLARLAHFKELSLARSSMATTAMLGLESLIAVPAALLIGVPSTPWLFWTILSIVAVWIVFLIVAWLLVHYWALHLDPEGHRWVRTFGQFADEFLEAGGELITWRTARTLIPTLLYMLIYMVDLYAIILAAGVHTISFIDTIGIYSVIVLAVILVPIPIELGITEFTGLGALLAYGIPQATAAIIMLSLRLLATGMTIVVSGLCLVIMRGQFAAIKNEQTGSSLSAG